MQSTLTLKIIISNILIVLLLIAGFIIHRAGKPYPSLIFTVHKLCTIAMIILMSIVAVNFFRLEDTGMIHTILAGLMILSEIGLLVSGGMMSLDKLQGLMLSVHRVFTGLFLVSMIIFSSLVIIFETQGIQS